METGLDVVSDVKDTGGTRDKGITITYDDYETGSLGPGTIWWRGSSTLFAQDSNEIVGPVWQLYTGTKLTGSRYIQVKVGC